MTHTFYSDAQTQALLRISHASSGYVPVVIGGHIHPVREQKIGEYPVASDLSAEDFVLGLEVLGCRFVRDAIDDVVVRYPTAFRSSAWETRARQIHAVMSDYWEGRRTAVSDYLHEREGEWLSMTLFSSLSRPSSTDAVTLAVTVHQAFDEGHVSGCNLAHQAGRCPYLHDQPDLRRAWMDGFAKGRLDRKTY